MVGKFICRVLIVIILTEIPQLHATRFDIFYSNNVEFEVDVKTKAMAELTRKCLLSKNKLLTLSDEVNSKLIRYLHRSETTAITSLSSSKLFVDGSFAAALKSLELYYGQHYYRFLWKSGGFLLSASSPVNLKEQLDQLKNTRWWNSSGFFLFTEEIESVAQSCANAYEFLSMAWKYGLLSCVFLCQEEEGDLTMYSYDPYGDSAPQPWVKVREVKGPQGHPWKLFKWTKYDGRRYDCETIFFDKTKSLNGYPISTSAIKVSSLLYFNGNESGPLKYAGEDARIMRAVWHFINASVVYVPQPDDDANLGWIDDNGTFHGSLIDVSTGKVEIGMNSIIRQLPWKVTSTYPHATLNFCMVTKDRGTIPWLVGLTMVFDKWTMITVTMIFLFATITFGYINKRRYFSGCLNVLRVFVSTSFIRPPESPPFRLILFVIFLLPILTYSTLQGKILSMIQHPLKYANIDGLADVRSTGYKLEGPEPMKTILPVEDIRNIFVNGELNSCLMKLYNDKPVACLGYCYTLYVKDSWDQKRHLALQKSPYYHSQYIAKADWPLVERFNVLIQRLVQSGLTSYYRTDSLNHKVNMSALQKSESSDTNAAVIHLKDFVYIFIGLGIGLICGILAFIGELLMSRSKTLKALKTRLARVIK